MKKLNKTALKWTILAIALLQMGGMGLSPSLAAISAVSRVDIVTCRPGAAEGAIDAANILKPALARGELQAIGATTLDEYRKYIEKDAALERRFQKVLIDQPTVEDTISILRGLKERFEIHHGVRITDNALIACATLSDRYITDRFLPDKAIDLMDEAASKIRMEIDSMPAVIRAVTYIIPARYFVSTLQSLFLAGNIPVVLVVNVLFLIASAVMFIGLTWLKTKRRLD